MTGSIARPGNVRESARVPSAQYSLFSSKVDVRHLFISGGHSYFGRHGKSPAPFAIEEVAEVECLAGRGLKGDRFFDHKENYRGQITFFDWSVFERLRRELSVPHAHPSALRRNVVIENLDLTELIGSQFEVQGVTFEGVEECRPCYWMDQAFVPGTEAWLKGRGGLRCRILSNGQLRRTSS